MREDKFYITNGPSNNHIYNIIDTSIILAASVKLFKSSTAL